MNDYVERQLTFIEDDREQVLAQGELLSLQRNIVVLGEAGAGKTRLLQDLERNGARYVLARRLIHAKVPAAQITGNAEVVLIDAVDEAASSEHHSAIDDLLANLESAGRPRFILTCRVEDWNAATAKSIIDDVYGEPPLEVSLRPFNLEQAEQWLSRRVKAARAVQIVETYRARGFSDWLGNPQTLTMLADVAEHVQLPDGTAELFEGYVDLALAEVNAVRRERQPPKAKELILDTLGVMSAAIVLSGREGVTKPGGEVDETCVPVEDLDALPGFAGWDAIAGSRLRKPLPGRPEDFTYVHRRIGEWLGARWLARKADTQRRRARLLDNMIVDGVVPGNLRGLFAWLSLDDDLADRVIDTDPMAVIEYADADALDLARARGLLKALAQLAEDNPWFVGWGEHRARALVRGRLRRETIAILADETTPERLRMLLAQQFAGETLSVEECELFKELVLETENFYALRHELVRALNGQLANDRWPSLISVLLKTDRPEDARLAAAIILDVGLKHFNDALVADAIMAAGGFSARGALDDDGHVGTIWLYRSQVPEDRLGALLDALAERSQERLPEYRSIESSEIINLADSLVAAFLEKRQADPEQLLRWLTAFSGRDSYLDESEERIGSYLEHATEVRRSIQRLWFSGLVEENRFYARFHDLLDIHRALAFTDADLADFLERQSIDFPHWREAAWTVRHSESDGVLTRQALRRFVSDEVEYRAFIDPLVDPPEADWQIKNRERAAQSEAKRLESWSAFRRAAEEERQELSEGRFGVLMQAANVYFGRYSDLHDLKTADDRLNALLGSNLLEPFRHGLEAWLSRLPQFPHAEMLAHDYAESRFWNVRYVLLAALAERLRTRSTLDPLDPDQLIAAQLHITHQSAEGEEWGALRTAVWKEIVNDPAVFERYARLTCESSLADGSEIIMGLYEIAREGRKHRDDLVTSLAREWLERFDAMHWRPEGELLDVLLQRRENAFLRPLVERRLNLEDLSDERRRNWQAVGLIVDFDKRSNEFSVELVRDPSLFWTVRERIGARRPYDDIPRTVPTELAGWLVEHARKAFPYTGRPSGVTSGDTNAWDATDSIGRLIDMIGSDPSDLAGDILRRLASVDDGYHWRIKAVLAEHRRLRAEQRRAVISPAQLAAILTDSPPSSMVDLQSEVLRLLDNVQAIVKGSDIDDWTNFFLDDRVTPRIEEQCRDEIIGILRRLGSGISFDPERHLGDDREGDIACRIGTLHLPIEVKGQWHRDLWRAADNQLDAQQASDHEAEGYGILLALWFGPNSPKKLQGPPNGSGIPTPTTPHELEERLASASNAAANGKIRIKVLDLTRG